MNGRSMIILILAGLSGLGAMVGVNKLIQKGPERAQETREIVVAVRDLKVEELLKPDSIKLETKPKDQVPEGALTNLKDCEERWVNTKILTGEPIVEAKLAPKGSPPGLVAAIPKGKRAYAIEVNEQTGVSGFILPQHRVDVIQTKPVGGDGRVESDTILQNVLVLAVGQTSTRPEDKSIIVRTVTFAVTPDEVQTLVEARAKGPLSLALRGVNDNDLVERKPEPEKPVELKPDPPKEEPVVVEEKKPDPPKPKIIHIHRGPPGPNNRETIVVGKARVGDMEDEEEDGDGGLAILPPIRKAMESNGTVEKPPVRNQPVRPAGDGPPG